MDGVSLLSVFGGSYIHPIPLSFIKVTFGCQLWRLGQCVCCCLSFSQAMWSYSCGHRSSFPPKATWSLPFSNRQIWDPAILLSIHPDSIVLLPLYELFHCCEIGSCCIAWANPEYRLSWLQSCGSFAWAAHHVLELQAYATLAGCFLFVFEIDYHTIDYPGQAWKSWQSPPASASRCLEYKSWAYLLSARSDCFFPFLLVACLFSEDWFHPFPASLIFLCMLVGAVFPAEARVTVSVIS